MGFLLFVPVVENTPVPNTGPGTPPGQLGESTAEEGINGSSKCSSKYINTEPHNSSLGIFTSALLPIWKLSKGLDFLMHALTAQESPTPCFSPQLLQL